MEIKKAKVGRPSKDDLALRPDPTVIGPAQIDEAIEHILELRSIDILWKKLGFKSRTAFYRYCRANPEFEILLDDVNHFSCRFIEDEIKYIHDDTDAKVANVKLNAYLKLLAFRDPKKYGPKLDVSMNQTISIRENIEKANDRVIEMMKDATQVFALPAVKPEVP
jgi:hypothetical protein